MASSDSTLQLHEIAGYLPYGLTAIDVTTKEVRKVVLTHSTYSTKSVGICHLIEKCKFISEHKPILYPASELLPGEDIQMYSPLQLIVLDTDQYCDAYDEWCHSYLDNPEPSRLLQAPYEVIQELYKQHYDIHNLISRNLAVSIHSINK